MEMEKQDFSLIQIFREINFGAQTVEVTKNALFSNL